MREPEYRGKREGTNTWIFGGIYLYRGKWYIRREEDNFGMSIEPGTRGEYTGLRDRNGVKIFEGDVVDYIYLDLKSRAYVGWCQPLAMFGLTENMTDPKTYTKLFNSHKGSGKSIKVIGNIHDNPELLEAK